MEDRRDNTAAVLNDPKGKHYAFDYKGIRMDPYRVMDVYKITHPAHQHALKKLMRAGKSQKSLSQDIDEVILTLNRWKLMIEEDSSVEKGSIKPYGPEAIRSGQAPVIRNAKPPEPTSPHYPFYQELLKGGRVWRDDPLNNVKEWITLIHSGIQGNAANIVYYGHSNLSIEQK